MEKPDNKWGNYGKVGFWIVVGGVIFFGTLIALGWI